MIAQLKRPAFCGRFAVDTPANILQTKKAIRKAFQNQLDGKGFSWWRSSPTAPRTGAFRR